MMPGRSHHERSLGHVHAAPELLFHPGLEPQAGSRPAHAAEALPRRWSDDFRPLRPTSPASRARARSRAPSRVPTAHPSSACPGSEPHALQRRRPRPERLDSSPRPRTPAAPFVARLIVASLNAGTARSASSTRPTHAAQVIPITSRGCFARLRAGRQVPRGTPYPPPESLSRRARASSPLCSTERKPCPW